MEQVYNGNAIIIDNFDTLEITIPAKKNWFIVVFMCAWLCGWVMGEITAIGSLTGFLQGRSVGGFFIFFWLVGWTFGGFMAIKMLLWIIAGKEVVTVGKGVLKITRKGDIFSKAKTYDLEEIKNIRVQDDGGNSNSLFGQRSSTSPFATKGIIRFVTE